MPCVHNLCVLNTFPKSWSGLCHNDVSVLWMKNYYLYSIQPTILSDTEKQEKIKNVYHTLRDSEDVGITICDEFFDEITTPIVTTSSMPDYFRDVPQHVVSCYNYHDSNKMRYFDPFGSILDPSLTQITEGEDILSATNEEDLFMYIHQNMENTIIAKVNKNSFYSQMLPSFREVANWVKSVEDVEFFHKAANGFIGELKKKYQTTPVNEDHTYISSNISCETATKHHVCDGWNRKRV